MNTLNSTEAYCRLCACLKTKTKLINVQTEYTKRVEIVTKLARLNAGIDFSEEFLPKTVCIECTTNLDKAFDFIVAIDHAKSLLYDVLLMPNIIKVEENRSDDNFCQDIKITIKTEPDELSNQEEDEILSKQEKDEIQSKQEEDKISSIQEKDEILTRVTSKSKYSRKRPLIKKIDALPDTQHNLTWKDYSWTCCYCETQFLTVEELKTHSIAIHKCCNAFRCDDCNLRKLKLQNFLVHVKRHRQFLKFSCYICHAKFKHTSEATKHSRVHVGAKFSCEGCNSAFSTLEESDEHKKYYESKKKRSIPIIVDEKTDGLTCLICNKTFCKKVNLTTHLLTHTERKRDHTCEFCGKCFLSKQSLAGHLVKHGNERPFQCKICKNAFKTLRHLRNHVKVHDNHKPFSCDQCGRCFRLKNQLASHMIVHTDEMPHSCSFCEKRFRFRTRLTQHIRQHTGDRPYSCHLCERKFANWPNYNKHMKRKHMTNMAKKKQTPDGVYPVDPVTGEVVITPKTNEILEWEQDILKLRRPRQGRLDKKINQ